MNESEAENLNAIDESRWEKIATNLKTIGGAVVLALVIRTCLFEAFEIEGPSMEPTLLNGDRVVVAKFLFGLFLPFRDEAEVTWGAPELGDVVIIKSPADGVDIVKRVIGIGGDLIEVERGIVKRNGHPLPRIDRGHCETGIGSAQRRCRWYESQVGDQTFLTSQARPSMDPLPVHVPEGHIYVLGDHRDSSNDSRNPAVGAIPISRVKGKALSVYWSSGEDGLRWARMFSGVR
ncbi:MAG: signal peptidase I [Myxococcales bacterium]|jgi:signal peptidase I